MRMAVGHHGFLRNESGVVEPPRYANTDLKHRFMGTPHAPLPSSPPGSGRRARRLRSQLVKNGVPRRSYLPPGGPCPSAQHHSLHSHTLKRDFFFRDNHYSMRRPRWLFQLALPQANRAIPMEFMSKPLRPLYFDTAATTVVAPEVLACRVAVLAGVDATLPRQLIRPVKPPG